MAGDPHDAGRDGFSFFALPSDWGSPISMFTQNKKYQSKANSEAKSIFP